MISFDKNEVKPVEIIVEERDGSSITISSATFEVFDTSGNSVQASSNASITNNSSAAVTLSGTVDTSTSDFTDGESYEVKFTYTIGSYTYIDTVYIKLKETRI